MNFKDCIANHSKDAKKLFDSVNQLKQDECIKQMEKDACPVFKASTNAQISLDSCTEYAKHVNMTKIMVLFRMARFYCGNYLVKKA